MDKPIERRAIDALLERYPDFDLLAIDWQRDSETRARGPWLMVSMGQRSDDRAEAWARWEFAIWKETGAVYHVDARGQVWDEPILRPGS